MRKNNLAVPIAILWIMTTVIHSAVALFDDKEKKAMHHELNQLKKEFENLSAEMSTVKLDRDNVLKQTKNEIKEKEAKENNSIQ